MEIITDCADLIELVRGGRVTRTSTNSTLFLRLEDLLTTVPARFVYQRYSVASASSSGNSTANAVASIGDAVSSPTDITAAESQTKVVADEGALMEHTNGSSNDEDMREVKRLAEEALHTSQYYPTQGDKKKKGERWKRHRDDDSTASKTATIGT